jgi:hypothetical protein
MMETLLYSSPLLLLFLFSSSLVAAFLPSVQILMHGSLGSVKLIAD